MERKKLLITVSSLFYVATLSAENTSELETVIVAPSENQQKLSNPTKVTNEIKISDKSQVPQNLTDLITSSPSVSQNGQGGHFQNFSIRGLSKHRVKTLVNGIKIQGVRRAGASASFIDPLLLESASVLRNPASTIHGSGALGGAVETQAKHFTTPTSMLGYNSEGNENYQIIGTGDLNAEQDSGWSFGFARHDASNANAKDDTELNNHFTQYSATIAAKTQVNGLNIDFFALPSVGKDIGKSNTDFPDRETNYPSERHLLSRLKVTANSDWSADFFIHQNDLETEVLRVNSSLTTVNNEAFDYGGSIKLNHSYHLLDAQYGIDYSGRRSVNADELAVDLSTQQQTNFQSLIDGQEQEVGLYSTVNWLWGWAEIEAGARLSYLNQSASQVASQNDQAWSAFVDLLYPFENGFQITSNISTGYRYPTLNERLFSGTTGRGQIISNPELDKERSFNIDLGLGYSGTNFSIASHVYYLDIKDYIERVEISDDVLTFVNLNNGTIRGLEIEGNYLLDHHWSINLAGHLIDGQDESGNPLADIPSNRLLLGLKHQAGHWQSLVSLEYRAEKNDPASDEKEIPSAKLISTSVRYQASKNLQLSASINNLLNEEYFASADSKSSFAEERSFGLNLTWTMD